MDLLERLLPTVCPQLWANDPERVQSLSPENVVIPGFLSNFRAPSEVELGFESLQGHSVTEITADFKTGNRAEIPFTHTNGRGD
jgi:hypothetical protein